MVKSATQTQPLFHHERSKQILKSFEKNSLKDVLLFQRPQKLIPFLGGLIDGLGKHILSFCNMQRTDFKTFDTELETLFPLLSLLLRHQKLNVVSSSSPLIVLYRFTGSFVFSSPSPGVALTGTRSIRHSFNFRCHSKNVSRI